MNPYISKKHFPLILKCPSPVLNEKLEKSRHANETVFSKLVELRVITFFFLVHGFFLISSAIICGGMSKAPNSIKLCKSFWSRSG